MNAAAGQGHTGADLSETDILTALYFRVLDCDPSRLAEVERDHFILSKGHGAGGYYCTLAEAGFFPAIELEGYLGFDTTLPGHPVRGTAVGVEFSTGALGHGLAIAAGLALSLKKSQSRGRVFVLLGDGELQEGSNWEAAMAASRFGLGNLVSIVDRNGLQLADRTEIVMPLEPLADKWRAFGWELSEIDGHDMAAIVEALEGIDRDGPRPHAIIAHTVKGKGVSFIEDSAPWHHKVPVDDEVARAIKELE